MFEEHIAFLPRLRLNSVEPSGQVFRRVFRAAEAEVSPVGSDNEVRFREVIGMSNAQGSAMLAKAVEDVVVEPRSVAKLESYFGFARDQVEECFQTRQVLFEIGRQAEKDGPEAAFERGGDL